MEGVGGGGHYNPRTVEEVFRDFKGRRAGMIKALTTGLSLFFSLCFLLFRFPRKHEMEKIPEGSFKLLVHVVLGSETIVFVFLAFAFTLCPRFVPRVVLN